MTNEQIKRSRYVMKTPLLDRFYPQHERQDVNDNDLHSRDHEDDIQAFHLPLSRLHNAALHEWGVAQGLGVKGVLGAAEIAVDPGVAIDASGQIISLAGRVYTGTEATTPPLGEHDASAIIEADPITLDVSGLAGETVYVTVRFVEILQDTAESVAGTLEHLPWLKLQRPVDFSDDGMTIILAVATIHAADGTPPAGTLDDLTAQEAASPNGRRLSGQTVSELRIRQPNRVEEAIDGSTMITVSDVVPSATIRAGASGGLRVTVPDPADTISFARDDDGPFAGLSINAGATTLQGSLHVDGSSFFAGNVGINNAAPAHQLDVNGAINATDILRNGSSLVESKWDDADGGINFSGGRVGVGSAIPGATLDVAGAIKLSGGNTLLFHRTNEAGVPNGDGVRLRYEESFFGANRDALLIEKTDGNQSSPGGGIAFVNTGNDGLVDTALAIRGDGNVGIGTKDPKRKLVIQGNRPRIGLSDNDGDVGLIEFHEGSKQIRLQHWTSFGAAHGKTMMALNTADGRVGIGTVTPESRLDVFTSGAKGSHISIHNHKLSLKGVNDPQAFQPRLPYIEWRQANNSRAMYLGWGQTNNPKRIEMRLENDFHLAIRGGKVGIGTGTSSPRFRLDVRGGDGWIGSGDNSQTVGGWRLGKWSAFNPNTWVYLSRADRSATYQDLAVGTLWAGGAKRFGTADDLAEMTPVKAEDELEPGDVVVIDYPQDNQVLLGKSSMPYDHKIAGIVSDPATAGLVIGGSMPTDVDRKDLKPIALAGRVLTNVTLENGTISPGDPLTSSSIPGFAMKATKPGYIVGKALQSFNNSSTGEREGRIWVMVSVSWIGDGSN